MYHNHSTHRSSISRDFMVFGSEALGVHRAMERREASIRHANARGTTQPLAGFRHWLGGTMISLGSWLAGAATPTASPVQEQPLAPGR